jgi:Uma2 family endonuclease
MGIVALKKDYFPYYTYEDYCQWEGKWEIISGIAYAMTPAPSVLHQSVSHKIDGQLFQLLEECENCHALLPVDWQVAEDTIVQPDHLVVCGPLPQGSKLMVTPSLIFEILSYSTRKKDENLKFDLFEAAGVLYYCLVDPEKQSAKLYMLENGRYTNLGTFNRDNITISLPACSLDFNFGRIWV